MNHHLCYDDLLGHLLTFMQMPYNFPDLLFPYLTDPITSTDDCLVFKPEDVAAMAYWLVKGYIRTYKEFKQEEDREYMEQITEHGLMFT